MSGRFRLGLIGTRSDRLGSPARPPARPELPTLRLYGPSLAPRSQVRLHGQTAPEAASDPRPCPESRRASRPSIQGTAAAQASAPGGRHRRLRGSHSTAGAATASVNSASSASLATCRAGQPYGLSPLQLPARTAVRAAARPKLKASWSPSSPTTAIGTDRGRIFVGRLGNHVASSRKTRI